MKAMKGIYELGRLAAVIAITAALGLLVAGVLSGSDDASDAASAPVSTTATGAVLGARAGSDPAEVADAEAAPEAEGAPEPEAAPEPAPAPVAGPEIRVRDAVLAPANTPRGRARMRARLTLAVRVTNNRRSDLLLKPGLVFDGGTLRNDPAAPDTIDGPVRGGRSAAGILSFELAGEQTDAVQNERRATLRIAGESVEVDVSIGPPVGG